MSPSRPLGGLVYGPLIYRFAREAKGHGVPEVMAAVALRGGRIRPSVAVVKSLASALCIGSGGSVGREGPIVQIGSTIGSVTGQLFKMSDQRVRTLVACGAAGGIAATFNAPIAGVFFALELILGEFSARSFGVVVIASVTAAVIGRSAFGDVPAFVVPAYQLIHLSEYVFYAILGVLGGIVGVGFTRTLYWFEDLFDRIRLPEWFKPVPGGLALGLLGLFIPQIFGVGYDAMGACAPRAVRPGPAPVARRRQDPRCLPHHRLGRLGRGLRPLPLRRGHARGRLGDAARASLPGGAGGGGGPMGWWAWGRSSPGAPARRSPPSSSSSR